MWYGEGWWGAGLYWIMYRRLDCVHTTKWIMNDAITDNLTGARLSSCHLQYLQPSVPGNANEDTDPPTPQFPPPLFNQYTADVIFVVGSLGVIIQETTLWGYKALMQPWPPHCKTHKSHVEIRIPTQCHVSVAGIRASSLQPFWQPPKKKKKNVTDSIRAQRLSTDVSAGFLLAHLQGQYTTREMPTLTLPRPSSDTL